MCSVNFFEIPLSNKSMLTSAKYEATCSRSAFDKIPAVWFTMLTAPPRRRGSDVSLHWQYAGYLYTEYTFAVLPTFTLTVLTTRAGTQGRPRIPTLPFSRKLAVGNASEPHCDPSHHTITPSQDPFHVKSDSPAFKKGTVTFDYVAPVASSAPSVDSCVFDFYWHFQLCL